MRSPVGILLCAGEATRFGGDKLRARLPDGRMMVQAACANLHAAVPDVLAVVRPHDEALTPVLLAAGAKVVVCENARQGMGASLACGVKASREASGWLIALGDMPWIKAATIRSVADALDAGAAVAVPACNGRRGHPVGFARSYFEDLCALGGDVGARDLVQREKHACLILECDDEGVLRDVDTPEQLGNP
jgi:molybdenum cofactor cytidylyltransferase